MRLQPVQAAVPRRGTVRTRLGMLEDVVGRPETGPTRTMAMSQPGTGLSAGKQYEDELTVREAELAMLRRIGTTEHNMLNVQSNVRTGVVRWEGRTGPTLCEKTYTLQI